MCALSPELIRNRRLRAADNPKVKEGLPASPGGPVTEGRTAVMSGYSTVASVTNAAIEAEGRLSVAFQPARRSSTSSIQCRTGVAVPDCKCEMQPMLADTMAHGSGCAAASAASLRSRNWVAITGCSTE